MDYKRLVMGLTQAKDNTRFLSHAAYSQPPNNLTKSTTIRCMLKKPYKKDPRSWYERYLLIEKRENSL